MKCMHVPWNNNNNNASRQTDFKWCYNKINEEKAKSLNNQHAPGRSNIVEIAAQLVSHSSHPFADLYNLKNTSKFFYAASKDEIVKQGIALEREFPSLNWTAIDGRMPILNVCAEAGNAEACFILALINIFDKGDIPAGVDLLKKAICKGHREALYLMNIVTLRFQEHHDLLVAVNSHGVIFRADEINFGHSNDQFELNRQKVVNLIRHISCNKWQANVAENNQQWCQNSECGIVVEAFAAMHVVGIMSIFLYAERCEVVIL